MQERRQPTQHEPAGAGDLHGVRGDVGRAGVLHGRAGETELAAGGDEEQGLEAAGAGFLGDGLEAGEGGEGEFGEPVVVVGWVRGWWGWLGGVCGVWVWVGGDVGRVVEPGRIVGVWVGVGVGGEERVLGVW